MHFDRFTSESMALFGQELLSESRRRSESIRSTRDQTAKTLADFHKAQDIKIAEMKKQVEIDADNRRIFMSELRSGVHSLLGRFKLLRQQRLDDCRKMAQEFRDAANAFREKMGQNGGLSTRH
jgi:hypothetical protein